jgi:hypothetical protein
MLHYFLGIDQGLLLTQSKYIYSILNRAKIQGAKTTNTLMTTRQTLS